MKDVLTVLKERRSCRKYTTERVAPEIIEKIVEAGTYAPTAMGRQSPFILIVDRPELRNELSKMNASVMGTDSDPFYGAPQVIVVLANKSAHCRVYDGSLVMGSMMTAAEALGVSACWIHRAKEVFETERGKEILREAGITEEVEGIGNLIIGYDAGGKREAAPRKENYVTWVK